MKNTVGYSILDLTGKQRKSQVTVSFLDSSSHIVYKNVINNLNIPNSGDKTIQTTYTFNSYIDFRLKIAAVQGR